VYEQVDVGTGRRTNGAVAHLAKRYRVLKLKLKLKYLLCENVAFVEPEIASQTARV